MTDTLKPVAWIRPRAIVDVSRTGTALTYMQNEPDEFCPLAIYTQDQLDAAVRAERERCATKAHGWLKNWAADLFGTWESYIEAKASGRHNGRRMSEGDADMFAKQFRERAEAVDDCADHVAAAIRELDLHAQGRPQAAGA